MTDTSKQDTSKAPAQPAPGPAGQEPRAKESASTDGATASGAAQDADTGKPDLDETKRKFRAALERKNQAHGDAQGTGGRDNGKINGAHGPAASRRSFRRKSG